LRDGKLTNLKRPFLNTNVAQGKGSQCNTCSNRESPPGPAAASGRGNQQWERTEARMGVRLLGRTMLCKTVVEAIIYGFVRTDYTSKLSEHNHVLDQGLKLPRKVISGLGRAYVAYWAKSSNLTVLRSQGHQFEPYHHKSVSGWMK